MDAVAEALVKILPDASEFNEALLKKIQKQVESASRSSSSWAKSLETVGGRFQTIGSNLSSVGGSLTKYLTAPIAGAVAASASLVSALGFKRLVGLDTARAQFQGLGYDADAVMKQVEAGVTDTSLSMVQGAESARAALATGVIPIEDLESAVKRVANVSAAYGVDAAKAGELINNAYIQGGVSLGLLTQLTQNNIPATQALADTFNKTQTEIQAMASAGEISAEMLAEALDNKAGAAAESFAGSWQGITSNIISNLGKIGAKFLEPSFEILKDKASDFLSFVRSPEFSEWAETLGQKLAEFVSKAVDQIQTLIDWWGGLSPSMQKAILGFAGFLAAAGPVLSVFGKISSSLGGVLSFVGKLGGSSGTLLKFLGPVGLIATGLIAMYTNSESFREAINSLLQVVGGAVMTAFNALGSLFEKLSPLFSILMDAVSSLAEILGNALGSAISTVMPVIEWLAELLGTILTVAIDAIGVGIEWLVGLFAGAGEGTTIFGQAWEWVQSVLEPFAAWISEHFGPIVSSLGELFGEVFTQLQTFWDTVGKPTFDAIAEGWDLLWGTFVTIWEAIGPPILTVIETAWENLKAALEGVWNAIKIVVETVLGVIKGIIDAVTAAIRGDWEGFWEAIWGIVTTIWNGILSLISNALNTLARIVMNVLNGTREIWNNVWGAISGFFSDVWGRIVSAAQGFMTAIKDKFSAVVDFVSGIPRKVLGFFKGIGSWLLDSGKALMQGFLDGISSGLSKARDLVSNGLKWVRNLFPFSPAKEGPFSGRGWVSFAGESLGSTFTSSIADALKDGRGEIEKSLDGLEDLFSDAALDASPTIGAALREDPSALPAVGASASSPGGVGLSSVGGSGNTYKVEQKFYGASPAAQVSELDWVLRYGSHAAPPENVEERVA